MPGIVLPDPLDSSRQVFSTVIPPLPAGPATLTMRNKSTGSISTSMAVTISPPTALLKPATQIVDQFLADSLQFLRNIPTSSQEQAATVSAGSARLTQARNDFLQLVGNGLTPEEQQGLNQVASVIQNSDIYTVQSNQKGAAVSPAGYDIDTKMGDFLNFEWGVATILAGIASIPGVNVAFVAFAAGFAIGVGILIAGYYLCKLIRGGKCFDEPTSDPPPNQSVCQPSQTNSGSGTTGMGSAPPPGGNGCGNSSGPPPGTAARGMSAQASIFEQPPGRYVIKVFSRSLRTPFTGLTDAGG